MVSFGGAVWDAVDPTFDDVFAWFPGPPRERCSCGVNNILVVTGPPKILSDSNMSCKTPLFRK